MYQILPLVAAMEFALPNLPVELWAIILRCLDPSSLLIAVRSNDLWNRISQGDPILKKTINEQVLLEKQRRREELLNPGLLISSTREGPGRLFGSNKTKIVQGRIPTEKVDTRTQGKRKRCQNGDAGPLRKKMIPRNQPCRNIRC